VPSSSPRDIVETYFGAWTSKDFDTARSLLRDDLSFTGPIDTFDNADSLIESLTGLSSILESADIRRVFVDGDEVCVFYDLHTGPAGTAPVAEWYQVRGDRIGRIQAIFDARPFAPLFEH